jgi:hypothetical protein
VRGNKDTTKQFIKSSDMDDDAVSMNVSLQEDPNGAVTKKDSSD